MGPVLIWYQTQTGEVSCVKKRDCTELIAYEKKWKFVIAVIDCPIVGIWGLLYPSVRWPSFHIVQVRRSHHLMRWCI